MKVFGIILYNVGMIFTCASVYYTTLPQKLQQLVQQPIGNNAFINFRDVANLTREPSDFTLSQRNFSWGKVLN